MSAPRLYGRKRPGLRRLAQVTDVLEETPATVEQLVERGLGCEATVRRALRSLVVWGCVRVGGRGPRGRRGVGAHVFEAIPVAMLAALIGCASPTEPTATETYALVAFNGHEVPTIVIADTVGTTAMARGTLTLGADGRFTEATVQIVRYTPAVAMRTGVDSMAVTGERIGTWSRRRDRVAFRLADGSGWDAAVTGQQLRYAAGSQRFVWGRP
jgi:hypothetical protein